jgi:hypothetical protein
MQLPGSDPKGKNEGVIVIRVDDMVEGGTSRHRSNMEKLQRRFEFGKYKSLQEAKESGTLLAGKRLIQKKDYSFTSDMNEYAATLTPMKLDRPLKDRKGTAIKLNEAEITRVKGVVGGVSWLASNGRPELSAAASLIPMGYKEAESSVVTDANFAVKVAQSSEYSIKIWSIPAENRRYFGFFDASFDPKGVRNQLGRLIGCCSPALNRGDVDRLSIGYWKSQKLEAKAGSPNATETHACARAVADVTWYRALVESLTWADWDIETQNRKSDSRKVGESYMIADESPTKTDPDALIIGDSKGVYDNLDKEMPGEDRYSALQAAIIKSKMKLLRAKAMWLPHDLNPTDA